MSLVAFAPMFDWTPGEIERRCPVCTTMGTQDVALTIDEGSLHVSRCRECGSLATDGSPIDMPDRDVDIDSYVEATAGVETIGERLLLFPAATVSSFLDVGCGYGFGVDLAQSLFGWTAVGIEPSATGRRGAAELGLDIRMSYLTTDPLPGGPFDAVLASEVLEHVGDPAGLLVSIRAQLSAGGTLVLTTPAAEVVNPQSSIQTVTEVLSVPFHFFIASAAGLDRLLRACGFGAVQVTRFGAVLVAAARTEPGEIQMPSTGRIPPDKLEAYLRHRTSAAAQGSALELGMATRLLRSLVARGAFDAVAAARAELATAFLRRAGRPFSDPERLQSEIASGWSPPLSLPGAAFAVGMFEMLHTRDAATARSWFELAEAAVASLRGSGHLVDFDSLDIHVQSVGHGALCAAMQAGGGSAAVAALSRLVALVTRSELAWWRCRVFVEAVSAGHYDDGEVLLGGMASGVHWVAASPALDRRRAGLDALYTWGILRLHSGDNGEALQMFIACETACRAVGNDDHAKQLLVEATRHVTIASGLVAAEPGIGQSHRSISSGRVQATVETYWCDAYGMFVGGWMVATGFGWAHLGVRVGDVVHWVLPRPRPDVLAHHPDGLSDLVGFQAYVAGSTASTIHIVGRTENGEEVEMPVNLPAQPLPVVHPSSTTLDQIEVIASAPPGPVLLIGARAAEGYTRLDEVLRTATGREVVSVDIHPGIGVDLLADAHALSAVFPRGHFAVTTSAMVLEHLEVPWLVARECAAVTMPGGLAVHVGPFVWPEHAHPNDFWRFSPGGLAILFGPATGYEVVASGSTWPATVIPHPGWRSDQLTMPTLPTNTHSWVVSRRLSTDIPAMEWAYDPNEGAERARLYPLSALAGQS